MFYHGFRTKARAFLFVVTFTGWVVAPMAVSSAQGPNDLARDFIEQAPKKWNEYKSFASCLQGGWETDTQGEDGHFTLECILRRNARCQLYRTKDKGRQYAWVLNPRYSFGLVRGLAQRTWVIQALSPGDTRDSSSQQFIRSGMLAVTCLVQLDALDLAQLLAEPGFRVRAARRAKGVSGDLAVIDFENRQAPKMPVKTGELWLDPDNAWVLRRWTIGLQFPDVQVSQHGETEYQLSDSGFPIPKRLTVSNEHRYLPGFVPPKRKARGKTTVETVFTLSTTMAVPDDSEFTLSRFGLPEPHFQSRRVGWYLWLAVLGFGAIVAGLALRWYSRRARVKVPSAESNGDR